jgi:hypothetical protein
VLLGFALVVSPAVRAADGTAAEPNFDPTPYVAGGGLEKVKLSPDGTRLAGMVRSRSGIRALVTQRLDGSDRQVVYHLDAPNFDLEMVRWLGSDRFLARVSKNQGLALGVLPLPVTRWVVIGADGSRPTVLDDSSGGDWSNHVSSEVAAACANAPLVQVPAEDDGELTIHRFDSRSMRWLSRLQAPRGSTRWHADASGEVRLALGPPEQPSTAPGRWVRSSTGLKGRWVPWNPQALAAGMPSQVLGLSGDGKSAYLTVRPSDAATQVWRLALDRLDAAPEVLLELSPQAKLRGLIRNDKTCEPVAVRGEKGEVWAWQDTLDALMAAIRAQLPDRQIDLLAWRGDQYLIRVTNRLVPTEHWVGSRSQGTLMGVGSTHPSLPEDLGLVTRAIELPGAQQQVSVLRRAATTGPLPALLCLSCELDWGQPSGSFEPLAAYWAQQGWAVVQRQIGPKSWKAVIDHLVASGEILGGRTAAVALKNHDGSTALLLGSEPSGPVQAVATLGALTDFPGYLALADDTRLTPEYRANIRAQATGLNLEAQRQRSPLHRAGEQKAAVLLIHATHDGALGAEHARLMHEALRARQHPSTLLILQDSTQQVNHPPYRIDVVRAIDRLIAPVLKGPPDTTQSGHQGAAPTAP